MNLLVTTEPNKFIQNIHHRMPVIISQKNEEKWILSRNIQEIQPLLTSYSDENMSIINPTAIYLYIFRQHI